MRYFKVLSLLTIAGLVFGKSELPPEYQRADSGEKSIAESLKLERVWKPEKAVIEIPVGAEPCSIELKLPAFVRYDDKVVVMRFRVRQDAGSNIDGWSNLLQIHINGQELGLRTSSGNRRILNHKEDSVSTTYPGYATSPLLCPFQGASYTNSQCGPEDKAAPKGKSRQGSQGFDNFG